MKSKKDGYRNTDEGSVGQTSDFEMKSKKNGYTNTDQGSVVSNLSNVNLRSNNQMYCEKAP